MSENVWLNADGTTSPILPATTASVSSAPTVPSQEFLRALVAAEEDRLRAEGWQACVEHIWRTFNGWLSPEDTYWVGRQNQYRETDR